MGFGTRGMGAIVLIVSTLQESPSDPLVLDDLAMKLTPSQISA
jgi:hypothetical protein